MLNIVVFGATGFCGKDCIPHLYKLTQENNRNLKWGIAGRSETKLKRVLQEVGREINADLSSIKIIVADINDYNSLLNMTEQTELLLNCCGPYRHNAAEKVIEACIETGTHHIDISAELDYSQRIESKYHEKAKEKGIYVVTACGFDSMSYELGVAFLQQQFVGTLNSIEIFFKQWSEEKFSASVLNYTTWCSVIDILKDFKGYREICNRAEANSNVPTLSPVLKRRYLPHKSDKMNGWIIPLLTNDKYELANTQKYRYNVENKRPVQMALYHSVPSLLVLLAMSIFGLFVLIMVKFGYTRKLLLDYPRLFTLGYIGKGNPPQENVKKTMVDLVFYGEGWKEHLLEKGDQYIKPVDACIMASVTVRNPAYGSTALMLVLAGIYTLTEREKLISNGKRGGFYTSGVMFAETSIIDELRENGLNYTIDYEKGL